MKKQIAFVALLLLSFNLYAQPWVEMVKDICPTSCYPGPSKMTASNGKIYFAADDGTHGIEPWVTDGSVAGTYMLKDVKTTPGSSDAGFFTPCDGKTFFKTGPLEILWVTDGTVAGTQPIKPGILFNIAWLTEYNNKLYFAAQDASANDGCELWVSDGTDAGTYMLTDINTSGHSYPAYLAVMNGKLYFGAEDVTNGRELWETDGTSAGTKLVADVYPGPLFSNPRWLTPMNNKLHFSCVTASGNELWVSDGTNAGTQLVKNITSSTMGLPVIENMMTDGSRLYFCAADNSNLELYVSDGTSTGTFMLKDINPGSSATFIPIPVACNGKVFFTQADGSQGHRVQLWVTDGTTTGTVKITDTLVDVESLTCFNNQVYFNAITVGPVPLAYAHAQIWRTDGTINSIQLIKPAFEPKVNAVYDTDFAYLDNSLYFRAYYDSSGLELWQLTDFPTTVASSPQSEFKLYPNPAANTVTIEVSAPQYATIRIYSVVGQMMLQQEIKELHSIIDIKALPGGIYTVYVQQNNNISVQKLVKNLTN